MRLPCKGRVSTYYMWSELSRYGILTNHHKLWMWLSILRHLTMKNWNFIGILCNTNERPFPTLYTQIDTHKWSAHSKVDFIMKSLWPTWNQRDTNIRNWNDRYIHSSIHPFIHGKCQNEKWSVNLCAQSIIDHQCWIGEPCKKHE